MNVNEHLKMNTCLRPKFDPCAVCGDKAIHHVHYGGNLTLSPG